MVKNGYILNVSSNNLPSFLDEVRAELKEVVRDQVLMQVAKIAERLYDMKFVEQQKYDSSILDMAVSSVAQRVSGVALGAFRDPYLDFRATLIVAKTEQKDKRHYVLLNTENGLIKRYFEEHENVMPYKFDRFLDEDDPSYEENVIHGEFWRELFEKHNWNMSLMGFAAQLSVQPDVSAMNITPGDLQDYFSDPEVRRMDYVKNSIAINKVRELLGNTPIEKVNPYTLLEYFNRGRAYLDSEQGEDECFILDEKVRAGFCNVDIELLGLSE